MPRPGSIFGNLVALMSALVLGKVSGFVAGVYLARVLGRAAFGEIAFVLALLAHAVIVVDFGLSAYGCRAIAQRAGRLADLLSAALAVRLLAATGLFAAAAAAVLLCPGEGRLTRLLVIAAAALFPAALTPDWVFKGLERMVWTAVWDFAPKVLYLLALVWLVHGPADLAAVAWARVATDAVICLGLLLILWRLVPVREAVAARLTAAGLGRLARGSAPLFLAAVMNQVYLSVDVLFLGGLRSMAEAGLYKAVYQLIVVPPVVFYVFTSVYQPVLARTVQAEPRAFHRHVRVLLVWAALAGLVLPAALALGSGPLLRLVYGPEYGAGAGAMRILLGSVWFECTAAVFAVATVAGGGEAQVCRCATAAALVSLAANAVLVPRYGIHGAAVARCGAYGVLCLSLWLACRRRFRTAPGTAGTGEAGGGGAP